MRPQGDTGRAAGLVLAAVASVQFGGALAATLLPRVGVPGSVGLRLAFAALALLAWRRPRVRGLDRAAWRTVGAYAAALTAMNLSFYAALERLPIGVAVTVEFVGPLSLAALTSRRRTDLLAIAVAAPGVLLVSGALGSDWASLDVVGLGFALLAGACWAAYIVTSGRTGARFDGLDGLTIALLLGAAVVLPWGLLSAGGAMVHPAVLATGAGVALLSSLLPYSLELVALRSLPANVFGILLSLEPAAAALAGWLVLGQTLSPSRLAGLALVVTASAVVLGGRRTRA